MISHDYSVENPRHFKGYGDNALGPLRWSELGWQTATAARHQWHTHLHRGTGLVPVHAGRIDESYETFLPRLGGKLWGNYGFHDGYNESQNWFADVNMALNQVPIVVVIENHRTGLIWKTSMSNPEMQPALEAIGFHKDCVALASRKDDLFCRSKVREASFPDLSHHANIAVGHFGDLVLDRSAQN